MFEVVVEGNDLLLDVNIDETELATASQWKVKLPTDIIQSYAPDVELQLSRQWTFRFDI